MHLTHALAAEDGGTLLAGSSDEQEDASEEAEAEEAQHLADFMNGLESASDEEESDADEPEVPEHGDNEPKL